PVERGSRRIETANVVAGSGRSTGMAFHGSRLGHVGLLMLGSLTTACSEAPTQTSSHEERVSSVTQATSQSPTGDLPASSPSRHEALRFPAQVATDKDGVPHIFAVSEADLIYLQGYVHA